MRDAHHAVAFIERQPRIERLLRHLEPGHAQPDRGREGDPADEATFSLSLPIAPGGSPIAFDRDDGVLIYSLDLVSNAFGDPFMGPSEYFAWGIGISSVVQPNSFP